VEHVLVHLVRPSGILTQLVRHSLNNVLWSQMFGATVIKMSFVSRHIPYRYTAPEPVLDLLRRDLARRTFRICYLCESCPA
jgi:hypothetical protein